MNAINNKWLFFLSVLLGTTLVLAKSGYDYWTRVPVVVTHRLTADISVTDQIQLNAIPFLKVNGFATIIDLRPDGEAVNQAPSKAVEESAHQNHIEFAYVPVPHGEIPASAVSALNKALTTSPRPILLYCRSGRRAVRTWSLVEASRPDGMDASAIQATAKSSGQSVDDLMPAIAQRIGQRTKG